MLRKPTFELSTKKYVQIFKYDFTNHLHALSVLEFGF